MGTSSPITDAVYGRRSTRRKASKPAPKRRAESLVSSRIGEGEVEELYRKLGFKRPTTQRRKRGGRS